jgi:hypothetical protein
MIDISLSRLLDELAIHQIGANDPSMQHNGVKP